MNCHNSPVKFERFCSRRPSPGRRPLLPTDREKGRVEFDKLQRQAALRAAQAKREQGQGKGQGQLEEEGDEHLFLENGRHRLVKDRGPLVVKRRRAGDRCLVPSYRFHEITCGASGCFALRYSPDGRWLAAACSETLLFAVKVCAYRGAARAEPCKLTTHLAVLPNIFYYDCLDLPN